MTPSRRERGEYPEKPGLHRPSPSPYLNRFRRPFGSRAGGRVRAGRVGKGRGKSFTCKGFQKAERLGPALKKDSSPLMINHSRSKLLFLTKYLINNRVRPARDGEALSPAQTPQVFRYKGPFLPKSSDTNSPSLPIGERANSPSLPIACPRAGVGYWTEKSLFCLSRLPKSSDTRAPSVR